MRKGICATCNAELPLAHLRAMDGKIYCEPCVGKAAESGQHGVIYNVSDPTICAKCSTDWGNNELPKVGGVPYCNACREQLYHYPFPQWLKVSLAGALLLLVVSLAHGAKYFSLGRALYRGEKQLNSGQYVPAAQSLAPVVDTAPNCEKCVLLLAKAHLLSGRPDLAWAAAKKHNDGQFETSDEEREVESLFKRFTISSDDLEAAQKLYQEHKEEESLQKLQAAAHEYPEWNVPRQQLRALKASIAFDHKDYDGFLTMANESYKVEPKSAYNAALVASALACKYAMTGDGQFFDESHKYLAEAQGLALTKEDQSEFQEYAERIEHRLKTKKILTREEYDRRYRPNKKPAEATK